MQPNILVAPLDWGLGHATRCIPVIRELLAQNLNPIIATGGAPESLLKEEFPELEFLPLPGYNIRYAAGRGFTTTLLRQLPHALSLSRSENTWVKKITREKKINALISDNRPGFYSATIPSVYITHQLNIKTGNALLDQMAQRVHYHFINKFSQCWVPDSGTSVNLAGELSHPENSPSTKVYYIGPLSRFDNLKMETTFDILFLLSGPELQRTLFEDQLMELIRIIPGRQLVLVRGLPKGGGKKLQGFENLRVYDHVNARDLNSLICTAEKVVARGGYSTIMDLALLQQPALLIPTPGQKEQEYLAAYLSQKKYFNTCKQPELGLADIVQGFENQPPLIATNLKAAVRDLKALI